MQDDKQSQAEPLPYFTAHLAKQTFRGLMPTFAGFWAEAREHAPPESLNAAVWPDYERVLRACQDVLAHAPMHPNEAKQANIQPRYERAMERLVTSLADRPGGLEELEGYIVTDLDRKRRRQRGLNRYQRAKQRSRRRRRR